MKVGYSYNKYKNIPTFVDDIRFASKKEAARYVELKLLEKNNVIHNLELQPRFPCIINGKKVCNYIADFRYFSNNSTVVEDVKGKKTDIYKLKKETGGGFVAWRNDNRGITIAWDDILSVVMERFNVTLQQIQSRRRHQDLVYARWFIIDFAHRYTIMSSAEIGYKLEKDHTSLLYANKQLVKHLDNNSELLYLYHSLTQTLEEDYYGL